MDYLFFSEQRCDATYAGDTGPILSKAGLGSRSEVRHSIGTGRVSVDGKVIQTPNHWVNPAIRFALQSDYKLW